MTKHEIIEKFPTENGIDREIQYLYFKMPRPATDRDLVREHLVWNAYNGNPKTMLIYYKSTTHDKYPPKEKTKRTNMIIGGMYLKEISDQETLIYIIENFDFKLTLIKPMVEKLAPEKKINFLPNLINYIEITNIKYKYSNGSTDL